MRKLKQRMIGFDAMLNKIKQTKNVGAGFVSVRNGITLVALVVTIIILLILAAITLGSILGKHGIIDIAIKAKQNYIDASEEEQRSLENLYSSMLIATNDDSKITITMEQLEKIIDDRMEAKKEEYKNPAGTIISYMGNKAPDGYLFCDGTTYHIAEYSKLAEQIKQEFGRYNYFGGDGTTTFAVPDLRGEFLRGTGTATRNTGSGSNVGIHQDATRQSLIHTRVNADGSGALWLDGTQRSTDWDYVAAYVDKWMNETGSNGRQIAIALSGSRIDWTTQYTPYYTAKPTNTSVLYCIKY